MILTVTLNPAVDKTIKIDNFNEGKVNRVSRTRIDAGGKGINVSRVIDKLGGKSKVLGFIGGRNGDIILDYLNHNNIDQDLIKTNTETRTNIKIVDAAKGLVTDINEKGEKITGDELKKLKEKILGNLSKGDIIVFSGSTPLGIGKDIYRDLILLSKEKGAKTILDADGELFIEGVKAKPYMIKPNIHELEKAKGIKLENNTEILESAKELINSGVENVLVSMGSKGAIFANKEYQAFIEAVDVEMKNTVGAGDSLVAGMAYSLEKDYEIEKALRLSIAAATLSVMSDGTEISNVDNIDSIIENIKITTL